MRYARPARNVPTTVGNRSSPDAPDVGSPAPRGTSRGSLRRDVLVTLEYSGAVRDAILALKYRGEVGQLAWMSAHLARIIRVHLEASSTSRRSGTFDVADVIVTWCPTTGRRRRNRGFDVSELLARETARLIGVRVSRLFRRLDRSPQTGATRRDRLDGPRLLARRPRRGIVDPRADVRGAAVVVIIDDVVTTGATLGAARRALGGVGVPARSILCAAVAATPHGCDR